MTTSFWFRGAVSAAASLLCLMSAQGSRAATTQDSAGNDAATVQVVRGGQLVPNGKGQGVQDTQGLATGTLITGHGIDYHGGPVMNAATGVNVYLIWYGDWATSSPSAKAIVTDMFNSIGGTPYFNTNSTYWSKRDRPANRVKNIVTLKGQIDDVGKSLGAALTDRNIKTLVSKAITSGAFPADPTGVYFVLTTKDVNATSGFCTQYCGWHTAASITGASIKYSFVGDAARCLGSCAPQSTSPNNNPGVDGMISVIVHELEEAASDPNLNAWYDSTGNENADKCAWNFGATRTAKNGSSYNVSWGGRNYMVQQNWVNAGAGYCALSY